MKLHELFEKILRYRTLSKPAVEKALIIATLNFTGNNKIRSAKLLNLTVRTLLNRLHKHSLERYINPISKKKILVKSEIVDTLEPIYKKKQETKFAYDPWGQIINEDPM